MRLGTSGWAMGLVGLVIIMGCSSGSKSDRKARADVPTTQKTANGSGQPGEGTVSRSRMPAIRIDAGSDKGFTDKRGNVWGPDKGFEGGAFADRGAIAIEGTDTPEIYRTERHGMESFSLAVPNGKYTVKLHFAETYSGVTAAGGRVFGVKVEDKDLGKIDVFKEAGKANKALIKSVEVNVADGKVDIVFTADTQRPEINGIEIIPAG